MASFQDLTGQKFNKLTALAPIRSKTNKHIHWQCRCDCGKFTSPRQSHLVSGATKSCGCINHVGNYKVNALDMYKQWLFKTYQHGAVKRNLAFELTKEQVFILSQQRCHYCNAPPTGKILQYKWREESLQYNGIDRIDSMQGYTIINVVPCCHYCNVAKSNHTTEEFLVWASRLYHYSILKEASNVAGR